MKPGTFTTRTHRQNRQKAFCVIMVLALVSLMLMHSMSLTHRLHLLQRELGQLEKEQSSRLHIQP